MALQVAHLGQGQLWTPGVRRGFDGDGVLRIVDILINNHDELRELNIYISISISMSISISISISIYLYIYISVYIYISLYMCVCLYKRNWYYNCMSVVSYPCWFLEFILWDIVCFELTLMVGSAVSLGS